MWGGGQLPRVNMDGNICPDTLLTPSAPDLAVFCMGKPRPRRKFFKLTQGTWISRGHSPNSSISKPLLPPDEYLSCPVTHVLSHSLGRRVTGFGFCFGLVLFVWLCIVSDCKVSVLPRTCNAGRGREELAGRFGGVSVKCGCSVTMMRNYKNLGVP